MTKKAAQVVTGFFNLSDAERTEVLDALSRHDKFIQTGQGRSARELQEAIKADSSGPFSGSCACCGR